MKKLDGLLAKQLNAVRRTVDRIPNGRTKLARYLGIRPNEVSRYLTSETRKPGGSILAGMQAFVEKHKNDAKAVKGWNA